jgi:hypothetical protein
MIMTIHIYICTYSIRSQSHLLVLWSRALPVARQLIYHNKAAGNGRVELAPNLRRQLWDPSRCGNVSSRSLLHLVATTFRLLSASLRGDNS